MAQWGFMVNTNNCVGCKACEVACKQRNGLKPGEARLRVVASVESGTFPNVQVRNYSMACMHCASPACMEVCPANAIVKDAVAKADEEADSCTAYLNDVLGNVEQHLKRVLDDVHQNRLEVTSGGDGGSAARSGR